MRSYTIATILALFALSTLTVALEILVGAGGQNYDPPEATVRINETITWKWLKGPHTVTRSANATNPCSPFPDGFVGGKFDSGSLSTGTFSMQFDTPGVVWYYCSVGQHCANGMKAKITVLRADEPFPSNANKPASASAPAASASAKPPGNSSPAYGAAAGVSPGEALKMALLVLVGFVLVL
ncbi:uncharacterized protein VTP21DRAFT_10097 [Calcarisporiella thermophila]|uniref:uncharacterized protein n=1 Tax=Calcarisporiella thermophila TaxID=911321 RepID=UPI0037434DA9